MTKFERQAYCIGVIVAAVLIVEMVAVLTEGCAKKAAFADEAVSDEYFIAATVKVPEKGQIRANSAMPCDDPDGFRNWLATYEEETDEQEATEEDRSDDFGTDNEAPGTDEEEPAETAAEVESDGPPFYRIAGEEIDEGIQVKLYQHLQEAGIAYWYEGALAQMYQESRCNQYAENRNGLDKGLFQYRSTFWDWSSGDIFDVDAQMRRYAAEMSTRFNMGLSMDEAISRHNTSDHVAAVNWEYVADVKRWLSEMEKLK